MSGRDIPGSGPTARRVTGQRAGRAVEHEQRQRRQADGGGARMDQHSLDVLGEFVFGAVEDNPRHDQQQLPPPRQ